MLLIQSIDDDSLNCIDYHMVKKPLNVHTFDLSEISGHIIYIQNDISKAIDATISQRPIEVIVQNLIESTNKISLSLSLNFM